MGLGAQELLLACRATLPLVGGGVALVLVLSRKKTAARPGPDDWDEPADDR